MQYDYLIVGAGLYGAVFAHEMMRQGRKVLVIDRRKQVAGNIYTEQVLGIQVHKYGAHIFHTSDKKIWEYVNRFAEFNHYINSPIAYYKGELYNLPFNMNTFSKMWGVVTPDQAREKIAAQIADLQITQPQNLEEQALSLVGADVYEKLVKGYTEKQWGRDCRDLPAFIIKRLPLRFTYDNNYFNHPHQGIPKNGYTAMVEQMLSGIEVKLGVDFLKHRETYEKQANCVVFTGPIDAYYDYCYGTLEYRSLHFETEVLSVGNYQGVAGMNFTDIETPYTRIVEHKHFLFGEGNPDRTVITREYPALWKQGKEPYYPINNDKNNALYEQYRKRSEQEKKVIFAGRLGQYQYFDMDKVIESVLKLTDTL